MKLNGGVFEVRSVHELDQNIITFSAEGWRITVIDRSTTHEDRFLIVAQQEPEIKIGVGA